LCFAFYDISLSLPEQFIGLCGSQFIFRQGMNRPVNKTDICAILRHPAKVDETEFQELVLVIIAFVGRD
jgi:hypothetical protein